MSAIKSIWKMLLILILVFTPLCKDSTNTGKKSYTLVFIKDKAGNIKEALCADAAKCIGSKCTIYRKNTVISINKKFILIDPEKDQCGDYK